MNETIQQGAKLIPELGLPAVITLTVIVVIGLVMLGFYVYYKTD